MSELMSRGAKAAQTAKERREERNRDFTERLKDRERAISVCRAIRDDENAADRDRLKAIELLTALTA